MRGKRLKKKSYDICGLLRVNHKNITVSHRRPLYEPQKSTILVRSRWRELNSVRGGLTKTGGSIEFS